MTGHNFQKLNSMSKQFKHRDKVIYVPEMYDQHYAEFLHMAGEDTAFIKLEDTKELKKVYVSELRLKR